ncbi:MAG: hypothetical protein JNJ54_09070 [Myxococcaceae bacterium]|nr:hypothetical protein [Myxococcaceae bacterium]
MWRTGLVVLLSSCAGMHRALDVRALEQTARLVDQRALIGARALPFTTGEELNQHTSPRAIAAPVERLAIGARTLGLPDIIEEQLAFRSQVTLRAVESNHARLYVYRQGALGERPVLLWVPGLAVSDVALSLLRPLLIDALAEGFDVVFFVPPYHLERSPAGVASGDAVLATDLSDHLGVVQQGVADLRETMHFLRRSDVKQLGAFAGSLGANLALHAAQFEGNVEQPAFDFLVAMIPLIDWSALVFQRPEFEQLRTRLEQAQRSSSLRAVYDALELSRARSPLPAESISVIAAAWDQVTPAAPRERWQRAWGLHRVTVLDRGHGTMLLGGALRDEARRLLREERWRLDHREQPNEHLTESGR